MHDRPATRRLKLSSIGMAAMDEEAGPIEGVAPILNQGDQSTCTAHALASAITEAAYHSFGILIDAHLLVFKLTEVYDCWNGSHLTIGVKKWNKYMDKKLKENAWVCLSSPDATRKQRLRFWIISAEPITNFNDT